MGAQSETSRVASSATELAPTALVKREPDRRDTPCIHSARRGFLRGSSARELPPRERLRVVVLVLDLLADELLQHVLHSDPQDPTAPAATSVPTPRAAPAGPACRPAPCDLPAWNAFRVSSRPKAGCASRGSRSGTSRTCLRSFGSRTMSFLTISVPTTLCLFPPRNTGTRRETCAQHAGERVLVERGALPGEHVHVTQRGHRVEYCLVRELQRLAHDGHLVVAQHAGAARRRRNDTRRAALALRSLSARRDVARPAETLGSPNGNDATESGARRCSLAAPGSSSSLVGVLEQRGRLRGAFVRVLADYGTPDARAALEDAAEDASQASARAVQAYERAYLRAVQAAEAWPSPTTRSSARAIGHERACRQPHQRLHEGNAGGGEPHAAGPRNGAREDLPNTSTSVTLTTITTYSGMIALRHAVGPRSPRRSRAKAYRVTSGAKRRRPIFFSRLLGRAKGAQPPFSVRARLGPRRAGPRSGPPSYPPPAPERRRRARTRSCANRAAARRVARRGGRRRRRRARLGRKSDRRRGRVRRAGIAREARAGDARRRRRDDEGERRERRRAERAGAHVVCERRRIGPPSHEPRARLSLGRPEATFRNVKQKSF